MENEEMVAKTTALLIEEELQVHINDDIFYQPN